MSAKTPKRPSDFLQNREARAQRNHLRVDTLARFTPFLVKDKLLTREHLLQMQKDVAVEFGISTYILNNHWRNYCVHHYDENRRWPGPETDWRKRYKHIPVTSESYADLKAKAERKYQEYLEEEGTSDCGEL